MCLAIYKPNGISIKTSWLENGFEHNSDGAGFAVAIRGRVEIHKGFFTFEAFKEAYAPFSALPAVIHLRAATHGGVDKQNCHPWALCRGKYALVHNGILPIQASDTMSDTGHFANYVLGPMLERGISPGDPALRFLVESTIGNFNKIAILQGDGSCTIYNENQGAWNKGAWYSNTCYERKASNELWRMYGKSVKSPFPSWPDDDYDNDAVLREIRADREWSELMADHESQFGGR